VTEAIAYYVFGFALSAALAVAVGRSLVVSHGKKIVPSLCVLAVLLGLLVGWAINGYIAYIRESALRF
jgi:hypothetical protein